MIESVKISNFQSLQDVELALGKFTVIVGASSSGKSALTRALHAVTSNALDSDSITRGAKVSTITVHTDSSIITIERDRNGSSFYRLVKNGSQEQIYTKLNRSVPSEIAEALGISPTTQDAPSLNFAGQFDTPYLLKEGSSSVARILGELTNVSTIFAAVREANRRTKAASTIVNLRQKDVDRINMRVKSYISLGPKLKAMQSVEALINEVENLAQQVATLRTAVEGACKASEVAATVCKNYDLPDLGPVLNSQQKLNEYKALLKKIVEIKASRAIKLDEVQTFTSRIVEIESELHSVLVRAGRCPTCNQAIEENK